MSLPKVPGRPLSQPGLEVVFNSHDGPQVVQPEKEAVQPHWSAQQSEKEVADPFVQLDEPPSLPIRESQTPRRICNLPRKIFWILVLALALLAIGLGIGLGVGLGSNAEETPTSAATATDTTEDSSDPSETSTPAVAKELRIGGSLDPSYYSAEGVWNGTGLAHNWQSFSSNYGDAPEDAESLGIYYQHRTGAFRWMRYTTGVSGARQNQRSWPRMQRTALRSAQDLTRPLGRNIVMFSVSKAGCTLLTRVAMCDRQKLRCTISADAQVLDIDRDYRVRQRSGSNATNAWTDGSTNDKNLEAYCSDLIGLHACPASPNADTRLWYASNETTFEEYTFSNDDEWTWQRSWTGYSAAAGVGCYSWGPDNHTYAAFVNLDNALELWYKEKTDEDPEGWRQSMFQPPLLFPSKSSISSARRRVEN